MPEPPTHTIRSPAEDPALWERYLDCRFRNLYQPFGLPRSVTTSALDHPPDRPDILHRALLIRDDLAAIGRLDLQPDHELGPSAQLRYFAVDAAYRGTGVGQALLRHLESEARRFGLTRLWMDARTAAKGFYARAGYHDAGEGPVKYGVIPHRIMEKAL